MNKSQTSPINSIWLFMIISATVIAAYNGRMTQITEASFEGAKNAVTLAIGLIGSMALWLGIIQIVETAGGMKIIARLIYPLMVKLFPDIPASHPAMSAIILSLNTSNGLASLTVLSMLWLFVLHPLPPLLQ